MNFGFHQILDTGIAHMQLNLDEHDLRDVLSAMRHRVWKSGLPIPDASHDDADGNGRVLAEICRSYLDQKRNNDADKTT